MDFSVLLLSVLALSATAFFLRHKRTERLWREELEGFTQELTAERKLCLVAYQNYYDVRPLPEDRTWLTRHGLIFPTKRGKWALTSKGIFFLRN